LGADYVPAVETAGYIFSLHNFNITRGFNHGKHMVVKKKKFQIPSD